MPNWTDDSATSLQIVVHDVVEVPDKIVVHMSSTATSGFGQPYASEYFIMMQLVSQSDGKHKIMVLKEYVDSKYMTEFFAEEKKRCERTVRWRGCTNEGHVPQNGRRTYESNLGEDIGRAQHSNECTIMQQTIYHINYLLPDATPVWHRFSSTWV